MAIRVLIVEDEILVAENLSADLEDLGFEVLGIALSSSECFAEMEKCLPDVILMDIQIQGEMNGIEVARQLKEKMPIPIIFLTSNSDPLTLGKALATKPDSFISKPYNLRDLQAAIEIAFQSFNEQKNVFSDQELPTSVFVKSGELYHRVQLDEILFVEASGSYCIISTANGDFILSMNLQAFINKMSRVNFVRTHRSFLVNIEKVDKFDNHSLYIMERELPISKSHREEVFKHLKKM